MMGRVDKSETRLSGRWRKGETGMDWSSMNEDEEDEEGEEMMMR